MSNQWTVDDFQARRYQVSQDQKNKELDKAQRIELSVKIDGRQFINMQLREPGMIAVVSRPDDPDGFNVEVVEPSRSQFIDLRVPDTREVVLAEWHQLALFGDK